MKIIERLYIIDYRLRTLIAESATDFKSRKLMILSVMLFAAAVAFSVEPLSTIYSGWPAADVLQASEHIPNARNGTAGKIMNSGAAGLDARSFSNFSSAVHDPSVQGKVIRVRTAVNCNSLTVPRGVSIVREEGGTINQSGTLTFAPGSSFTSTGTGKVFIGSGVVTGLKYAEPEWFGAAGDGITDDSSAIKYTAASLTAGGILRFTKSKYKYTLGVLLNNNTRMIGSNTELYLATPNAIGVVPGNDCEITGFTFSGTGRLSVFGRGAIEFDPIGNGSIGKRNWIHHNTFNNTISTSAISGNNIIDSVIEYNFINLGVQGEHGIYVSGGIYGSSGSRISNNIIRRTDNTKVCCTGINIKCNTNTTFLNNEISGDWDGYGIASSTGASSNVQIVGNKIHDLPEGTYGIRVGAYCADKNVIIEDNVINSPKSLHGIYSQASNVSIKHNKITNTSSRGIEIDGSVSDTSKTIIFDNDVINCGGGIRAFTPHANTFIIGNRVRGSGVAFGIDVDSGSIAGLVTGNSVSGYTANYHFNTKIPNDTQGLIWSPTLLFGGSNFGMTGTFTGRYYIQSSKVYLFGVIMLNNKGSSSGNATIGGLPFPANHNIRTVIKPLSVNTFAKSSPLVLYMSAGQPLISIGFKADIKGTIRAATNADIDNTTQLYIEFEYDI